MTALPAKGNADSLDNVAVTREQFRQDIGQFLEYVAQALGGVSGTYTTQSINPQAVSLQGTPVLTASAQPVDSDNSYRLPSTSWVRTYATSAFAPLASPSFTGTATFAGDVNLTGTGAIDIPAGTTAQRPASPSSGMIRFNSQLSQYEGYNGTAWTSIGGGATGGGSDTVFVETSTTVTTNYTLSTGKNAVTAGPVTINAGISVVIPSGQSWVIV